QTRLNLEVRGEPPGRCAPGMTARRRGAIINIASLGGFAPGPFMATYAATKAFVLSFSEAVATELRGTGVDVLCVCPGFTRTEFQNKADVDVSGIPAMAWMSADEVADQAVRTIGRTTGKEHTESSWFVVVYAKIVVQAGKDGKTDWYQNLLKSPTGVVRQDGYTFRVHAKPVTDAGRTEAIHRLFLKKYTSAWL